MKIICVVGHRGSGKTFSKKIFEEALPNCVNIELGKFMFESLVPHQKDFERIFGITVDVNNLKATYGKAVYKDVCLQKEYYELIFPFVEAETNKAIQQARGSGAEYVVLNYHGLSRLCFWKTADFRILLTAEDTEEKRSILEQRQIAEHGHYKQDLFDIQRLVLEEYLENLDNLDFVINNDYDDKFEADLRTVTAEILLTYAAV